MNREPKRLNLIYCVFLSFSPVTVPAEPPGFPRAACRRLVILHQGQIRACAPAFPQRAGVPRPRCPDGRAGSKRRTEQLGAHVSEQQPGGRNRPFPCRPNNRLHSYHDSESPSPCQTPTTRWRHVTETKILAPRKSVIQNVRTWCLHIQGNDILIIPVLLLLDIWSMSLLFFLYHEMDFNLIQKLLIFENFHLF